MARGIHPYLDVFVAAFRGGSLSAAARARHLAQSTVSYQLRQLEARLGAPVFERVARGVRPTALGERLFESCERFAADVDALRAAAAGGRPAAAATLRVATGSSFGRYVLAPALAAPAFADVYVDLRFGGDDAVFAAVAEGRAELGFAYSVRPSNLLAFAPVYRERLVLVAEAAAAAPARGRDWAARAGFVTYAESDAVYARWFEAVLARMPPRLRAVAHCDEIEEVAAFVAAGRGLAVVPRHAVARELAAGALHEVRRRAWPPVTDVVYAVRRAGAPASPSAERLLAALPGR